MPEGVHLRPLSDMQYQRYPNGGVLIKHVDSYFDVLGKEQKKKRQGATKRLISFTIYFNHVWEESFGGKLTFYNDTINYEERHAPLFNSGGIWRSDVVYHASQRTYFNKRLMTYFIEISRS